ncbi:MAG: outer membrane lipoprotein-sorting protein [Candidatus Cloacimonetes bacterium]|nr:outer membrane lipoprotein-sorting protein [Candidatus Cloacimonadota bacterium]
MKKIFIIVLLLIAITLFAEFPDGNELIRKVDDNMYSKNAVSTSRMIIHGRRGSRTMEIKSWTEGENRSFSEYLSPPRDAGTKMLKLEDKLWIYNPSSDRTIQISGHMLRQSMMGSDLSYEDMMEENELIKIYNAEVTGEEIINERYCWIVLLTAKTEDAAYQTKKVWIDKERYLPLREERFGKSGKLLKTTEIKEVFKIGKRWYPKNMIFKDVLKKGKGTEFIIDSIEFDVDIPKAVFTKAALRK